MPSVFISHSSLDTAFAERLRQDLIEHGIEVWLDAADLQHGEPIEQKVRQAIDGHDFLLVVLSRNSVRSAWAHFEVGLATSRRLSGGEPRVLPAVIDDCELPIYVDALRFADFRRPEDHGRTVALLVAGIRTLHRRIRLRRWGRRAAIGGLALAIVLPTAAASVLWWRAEARERDELSLLSQRTWLQLHSHPAIARQLAADLSARHPRNPEVLRIKGWALFYDHRYPEAQAAFQSGLDAVGDPESPTGRALRLGIANARMAIGTDADNEEARRIYARLIERHRHANAYVNIGVLSVREGRHAQAVREFDAAYTALRADGHGGRSRPDLAFVSVGHALARMKADPAADARQIVAQLDRAVCHDPGVLMFLLFGEEHLGFYGYADLTPLWTAAKTDPVVQSWVRAVDLAAARRRGDRCAD